MATTYTTHLKFGTPARGDLSGTWDTPIRDNYTLLDEAIGGYDNTTSVTTANVTLTMATTSCVLRNAVIELTGPSTGSRDIIVPAIKKTWIIFNNTTNGYAHTVKVSGQTGVSVPNGKTMILYCNGTDVEEGLTYSSGMLTTAGATMTGAMTWAAGTTTLAPFKFQAGVVQTTPVAHAVEWDGSLLYVTTSAAARKTVAYTDSNITGSAATLTTARAITITGDATWTVNFNGAASPAASAALTLAASGVTAATYGSSTLVPVITVDAKGRITSATTAAVSGGGGGTTTNSLTMDNTGSGAASGTTFNGSAAKTISYNTIGAAPTLNPTFTGTITAASATLSGTLTANGNTVLGNEVGDSLTVGATATFNQAVTFNGPTTLGNATGDTVTAVGHVDLQNNVTLGSAAGDTVTVNGTMNFVTQPTGMTGLPIAMGTVTSSATVSGNATGISSASLTATGKFSVALSSSPTLGFAFFAPHASTALAYNITSAPGAQTITVEFRSTSGTLTTPDYFAIVVY